jgi:chromate transporter
MAIHSTKAYHMRQMPDATTPKLPALLLVWCAIGLQSFGGGASTQLLIRREFVEKRPWVGEDELTRFWNLCQFAPGINLIALTILIGRKLGGSWGILVSLAGMLVPSAAVTCLLTAGFEAIQHDPTLHAVLRGIIPATAGIMGVVAFNFARPLLRRGQARSPYKQSMSGIFIVLGALALIIFQLPVFVVLIGVALMGIVLFTPKRTPAPPLVTPALSHDDQPP